MDIGRVCIKIVGRESGNICVIVDKKDDFLLIDGNVKRRLCNPKHLEPMDIVLNIKKGANTADVKAVMKKQGLDVIEKKQKEKKEKKKPTRKRKNKNNSENLELKKEVKATKESKSKKTVKKPTKKTAKKIKNE